MHHQLPLWAILLASCGSDGRGPEDGTEPPPPRRVDAVASPDVCLLDETGHLACALLTPALDGVTALDAGVDRVCALAVEGTETDAWCSHGSTGFVRIGSLELGQAPIQVQAAELADRPVLLTLADGTPLLWDPESGAVEEIDGMEPLAAAAVVHEPDAFTAVLLCGVTAGGEVGCLRRNHAGLQGEGTPQAWPATAVALDGSRHVACIATGDGVQCGEDAGWTLAELGWQAVTRISAGEDHACTLSTDGRVACFNATHGPPAPWEVALPAAAVSLRSGGPASCAALEDGEAWCWTADSAGPVDPHPIDGSLSGRRGGFWHVGPGGRVEPPAVVDLDES